MKKLLPLCAGILAAIVLSFTAGLLLGRNMNRSTIRIETEKQSALEILPTKPAAFSGITSLPGQLDLSEKPEKININTAPAEALADLPGIGQTIAQRIVDDRIANGPYRSVSDLMRVEGIGDKKLQGILDYVTTGG